eukprot:INCI10048.1.p1 GENE.INCI10048.1~~INCI10048.1.p1  ORF type:complete len:369 (-),score=110.41 INCI10048.1:205-1311(-)
MSDFFKKIGSKFDALKKHNLNALANFNVPETPDEEFQAAAATFYAMKENINTLVENATKFAATMKDFTKALEGVTEGFGAAMSLEGDEGAPACDAAAATQVVFDFSNRTQESCINAFNATVMEPLQNKRAAIAAVEEAIKKRQKLKEEYDYYYEKVRKLREKTSDSAKHQEKVDRNEPKLEEAKVELKQASLPLIALFEECQSIRDKVVAHEYENFKKCQNSFFSTGVEKFSTLAQATFELVEMPSLKEGFHVGGPSTGSSASAAPAQAAEATSPAGGTKDTASEAGTSAEPVPASEGSDAQPETTSEAADGEGTRAVALFDFEPNADDELKLEAGLLQRLSSKLLAQFCPITTFIQIVCKWLLFPCA